MFGFRWLFRTRGSGLSRTAYVRRKDDGAWDSHRGVEEVYMVEGGLLVLTDELGGVVAMYQPDAWSSVGHPLAGDVPNGARRPSPVFSSPAWDDSWEEEAS